MPHSWEHCFPFTKIRDEQRVAIDHALKAFVDDNKRFVVVSAGTGVGKSAIAITVARYLNELELGKTSDEFEPGSYILTIQKILQEQYVNDFSNFGVRSIKSSSGYDCHSFKGNTCGDTRRVIKALPENLRFKPPYHKCSTACVYAIEKSAFMEAPVGVTNFPYFLSATRYTNMLKPKNLLVADECHQIESQISSHVEVTFSERFSKTTLRCKMPAKFTDDAHVIDWVKKSYKPALQRVISETKSKLQLGPEDPNFYDNAKQHTMLDKHICKINRFISTHDQSNWVMNVVDRSKTMGRLIEFKPVDVSGFTEDTLFKFGKRVMLMSATVLNYDVFCRTLGIPIEETTFIEIPSPFKVENKLVYYLPVGSMSRKKISETLPVMSETVKMLLEKHAGEKGIIHCSTFNIAQHIVNNVKSDRIITHSSVDREARLNEHKASTKPTVLLSPSMMEGIDLAGDTSRFQIICKVPFPYLGDLVVQKRMKRDKEWYAYQTAKSIVQALGRSIRNENDFAVSYILDEDWRMFYARNRSMFPAEFHAALRNL